MYILVTPVKNEEDSLPDVVLSIINQTIKPLLWIIVDDGSTDNTPKIIKDFEIKYNWIKTIRLPPRDRDITYHYSYVCKEGFNTVIKCCETGNINYSYVALLDADTILESQYFEKLIDEFEKDANLGIASGGIYYNINGELQWLKSSENLPAGTGRMWTKQCFSETNEYLVEPSPDSISNVKAILRGWKIRKFKNIIAIQTRMTSSAEGLWKGYKANGFMAYYLNKHPLLILVNTIYYSAKKPYYIGSAFLWGYLVSLLKRECKIDDDEIKDYYWNTRLREYATQFANKFSIIRRN